ncbi:hypothetical protein H7F15_17965 [Pontibacter sp. Tf4]|uniref:hypothetical protein n=1 Tax=Pontibacter sp. Tf4 TaxID=2761620 RepID=UPI0016251DFB|nr:hypothetical protein [Pontibacter sp. Tf4]MBB6612932.1 hypothetical protein [Pontibacter sp. Tf4]
MSLNYTCFRSLLLVFVLLLVRPVLATDTDYIKAYHPLVHEAELLIINKDYAAALEKYKTAFAAVPEPFARDYYNAAVCATLSEDKKQTFDYLKQLALKGVDLAFVQKQKVFEPLYETKDWRKFEKKYPKYHRKYKRRTNQEVRAELDELYYRDRKYRFAEGGLRVYADTLRKIEDENVDMLLRTIARHGFPGEKLIGAGAAMEQLPRFSIVIERQTTAKKGFDFTPLLQEAVQQGNLTPQAAAYLMEAQAGNRKYKTIALVKVACTNPKDCEGPKKLKLLDKYLVERLSTREEDKVNTLRASLGLEPLIDYRKKVLYSLQDNRFMLASNWSVKNYVVPSKEAAKVLTDGFIVAETALASE